METNRLRQFKVVAELQNLRKAAEILHMSHSALSKSIKVLSAQLGKELLAQKGRNIEVTEDGKEFLSRVSEFLLAEDRLLAAREKRAAVIKIGTFESFSTHLIGKVWSQYFPGADLELRELLPGSLENALIDRTTDFGVSYEPIPTQGLEFIKVAAVEMKVYGIRGKFGGLPLEVLPFAAPVSPIQGTPTGVKGLDGWPDDKVQRLVKFRVDMMETGLSLARAGTAVIFAPTFVIRHHNESVLKRLNLIEIKSSRPMKPVVRKVYVMKRQAATETSEFRKLASLIRNECST